MAKIFFRDLSSVLVGRGHLAALTLLGFFLCVGAVPASGQTIVDEWASVQPPKPPELKPVTIDPKTTAFLVLDIVKQTCNSERRPRCVASVPKIQAFLKQARAKGVPVIYSVTSTSTAADILKEVTPLSGEPLVQASVDKFFKTDLEKIINDKAIKTVIVVGTAAHGAVLYTGSQSALRGLQVIVPVDGMSSENTYFEQYTAYHLANAPGVGQRVTLTKFDMIK
jgi:nicotinamidase-related amidase